MQSRKKTNKTEKKPTLYVYVTKRSMLKAQGYGRRKFGTTSKYLDHLIANDRAR